MFGKLLLTKVVVASSLSRIRGLTPRPDSGSRSNPIAHTTSNFKIPISLIAPSATTIAQPPSMMAQSNRILQDNMENRRSPRKRYTRHQEPPPQSFWSSISFQPSTHTLNRLVILCAGHCAKNVFDRQHDPAIFRNLPDPANLTCKECYDKQVWANSFGGEIIGGGEPLESHRKPWESRNHGIEFRYRDSAKRLLNELPQPKFDDGSYSTAINSFVCPHVSPLIIGNAQSSLNTINYTLPLVNSPGQVTVHNTSPPEHSSIHSSPSTIRSVKSSPNTIYTPRIGSPIQVNLRSTLSVEQWQPALPITYIHTPLKSCLKIPGIKGKDKGKLPERRTKKLQTDGKVTVVRFVDYEPPLKLDLTQAITEPKEIFVERDTFGPKKLNSPSINGIGIRKTANGRPVFHLDDFYPILGEPKEWPSKDIRVRFDPRTSGVPTNVPDLLFQPSARVPPEQKIDVSTVLPYTRVPQFSEAWAPAEYVVTSIDPLNSGVIWLRENGLSRTACLRPNDLSISSKCKHLSALKDSIREKEEFMVNSGVQAARSVVARANRYQPPHDMPPLPPKHSCPKPPVYRRPARPAGPSVARKTIGNSRSQPQGRKRKLNAAHYQAETARCANEAYERSQAAKAKKVAPAMERSGRHQPTSRTVGSLKTNPVMLAREESDISLHSTLTDQELLRATTGARGFKDPESPPRRKKIGAPTSEDESNLHPITEVDEEQVGSPPILIKTESMKSIDFNSTARPHDRTSPFVATLRQSLREANDTFPETFLSGTTKENSPPPNQPANIDTYFDVQAIRRPMAIPSGRKLTMRDVDSAIVTNTYQDPNKARQMARINNPAFTDHELNAGSVPKAPTPIRIASNNPFSGADSDESSGRGRYRRDPDWIIEPTLIDLGLEYIPPRK